jgi:hypothetical protein
MLDIKSILARHRGLLYRNVPPRPSCGREQVQILRHEPPAEWRCRECRLWFTYEPRPPAGEVAGRKGGSCSQYGMSKVWRS